MDFKKFLLTAGVLTALLLLQVPNSAHAQTSKRIPQYGIKSDLTTGSRIRQKQVDNGEVPVNLPYEELTDYQKMLVRSDYENMPEDDEPPFPKKGMVVLLEPLRQLHMMYSRAGDFQVAAVVDENGKVDSVEILKSPDMEMAKNFAQVLYLTPFKPAVCGGNVCAAEYVLYMQLTKDF